jgi:TonB family protein
VTGAPPTGSSAADPGERLAAVPDPGRGGGLRSGRGGVEGEPVPLDSKDPRYSDYLKQLRRQIQDKWAYPREAAERDLQGQLIVEIGIAKDGRLAYLDLRRSSGVRVLDVYAMNAVRLAQPFPPVPDRISLTGFPVTVVFNYILEIWPLTKVLR